MADDEARGISIRVFLVSGNPQGLRVVDRAGWTGVCLGFARADYAAARVRPELARTGVYILVGPTDDGLGQRVYIGEGDEVRTRIDSHHRGRDFWTHGYVLTTKDDSLNKAHIRFLESRFISRAMKNAKATIENATAPVAQYLGEADEAELEWYVDNALTFLPLLGVHVFETPQFHGDANTPDTASPLQTMYFLETRGANARGYDNAEGFVVLKDSTGRAVPVVMSAYQGLRKRLIEDSLLVPDGDDRLRLTVDYTFDSPSAAASVMAGGALNGRGEWKERSGRTLRARQEADVAESSDRT